jgi:hypothetical protein
MQPVAVSPPLTQLWLQDADKLLHFYPYIQSPYNYNCSAELREADKAPYTPGNDPYSVPNPNPNKLPSCALCQCHLRCAART